MGKHPILHYINEIKNKLGFSRTMTASGADVVDAVNGLSDQIDNLETAINTKNGLAYFPINLSSLGVNLTNVDNGIYFGYYNISSFLPQGVNVSDLISVKFGGQFRECVWFDLQYSQLVVHSSRALNYANYPSDNVVIWYRR